MSATSNNGWFCVHRSIMEWEWFKDANMVQFFIYCLSRANYEDNLWRGVEVKRGQFITSISKICLETGLSDRNIRTCIKRLKLTGEMTDLSLIHI